MRKFQGHLWLCASLGAILAGTAGQVQAQAADNANGDIIVTAQKREQNLQDVPVSVSVLSSAALANNRVAGIEQLAQIAPSVNFTNSANTRGQGVSVRGIGTLNFSDGVEPSVSTVIDGVVIGRSAASFFDFSDIQRVEVLRGPQGTLFGRNAPAGVVQVQSAKPVLGETSGSISLSDGTYNTLNAIGMLNVPIGNDWAVRLSAQEQHRDNWVHDPINNTKLEGYDDFAGRIQVLYKPSSDFSALFNFHGRDLNGSARLFRANIVQPGTNNLVPGFNPSTIYTDGKNTQQFSSIGGSARLNWTTGPITITSVTGYEQILNYYTQGDIDGGYGASYENTMGPTVTKPNGTVVGIPFAVETGGGLSSHVQLTQEVRAQSNYSGPLNWLAGIYYFDDKATAPSYDFDQLGVTVTDNNISRQHNNAFAAFASLDYKPVPRLELRGGLRFTHDHKTFNVISALNQSFVNTFDSATANNVSGDFSATYTVAPDVKVYARYANGFRAPSFGAPSSTVGIQVAKAEVNNSGEIGFKSLLFDRRVKLNADVFYYNVSNQQLTAVGGTDNSTRLLNAKKTIGYGAEVEFEAHITDELTFATAASYNFTKIEDPTLTVGVCASCTVINPVNATGNAYINGNPLPQAPRWTVDPSLTYRKPVGDGQSVYFNSDLAYRSQINFFLYESKEFTGQSFANLGLRAGYTWNHGKYDASVFCRNCLNQIRMVGGIDFDNLTAFINDPVIVGGQFTAKF